MVIELNEGEILFQGQAGSPIQEKPVENSDDNESIVDSLYTNAKEIGDKTRTALEESKITDKIFDGTKKIVDSSVELGKEVFEATQQKINALKVIIEYNNLYRIVKV